MTGANLGPLYMKNTSSCDLQNLVETCDLLDQGTITTTLSIGPNKLELNILGVVHKSWPGKWTWNKQAVSILICFVTLVQQLGKSFFPSKAVL